MWIIVLCTRLYLKKSGIHWIHKEVSMTCKDGVKGYNRYLFYFKTIGPDIAIYMHYTSSNSIPNLHLSFPVWFIVYRLYMCLAFCFPCISHIKDQLTLHQHLLRHNVSALCPCNWSSLCFVGS